MTVSPTDTLRRAINELERARKVEYAHTIGDAREVNRLLGGCDPEELNLLVEQLRELQFIVRTYVPRVIGVQLTPDEAQAVHGVIVGGEYREGADPMIDRVLSRIERRNTSSAPGPASPGSGDTGAQASEMGRVAGADLTAGERRLLREVETLGEETNLGGGQGSNAEADGVAAPEHHSVRV
jgi:hypothetical protein